MLCREVEFLNPFQFKDRTRERGKVWDDVASKLQEHGLDVSRRAVRDRYNLIKDNIKKRNNLEKRQSGIAPEMSEAETGDDTNCRGHGGDRGRIEGAGE